MNVKLLQAKARERNAMRETKNNRLRSVLVCNAYADGVMKAMNKLFEGDYRIPLRNARKAVNRYRKNNKLENLPIEELMDYRPVECFTIYTDSGPEWVVYAPTGEIRVRDHLPVVESMALLVGSPFSRTRK